MAPSVAQIPWKKDNDKLSVLLVESVIAHGAHLHSGTTKATALWILINTEFFDNDLLMPYKHQKGEPRKLQNHLNDVRKQVNAVINEGGNRSQKRGDWSELYQRVRQIDEELDESREAGEAAAEQRAKIQAAENSTLPQPTTKAAKAASTKPPEGYGKRKNVDGSFIEPPAKSSRSQLGFEERLFSELFAVEDITKERQETKVEREMLEYITATHKNTFDVYSGDSAAVLDLLMELGMSDLVNLYCAPGKRFEADAFKMHLKEMGFPAMSTHKIFSILAQWRVESTPKIPNDSFITPPTLSAAQAQAAEDSDDELNRFVGREYGGPAEGEDDVSVLSEPLAPVPAPAPVSVPAPVPVPAPAPAKKTTVRAQKAQEAAASSWRATGVMSTKDT